MAVGIRTRRTAGDRRSPQRPRTRNSLAAVGPLLAAAVLACVAGGGGAAAVPDGFRSLAPGVLTVIPPDTSADDTMQRGDILEITLGRADRQWTPKRDPISGTLVERAKERIYPRDVWCLEFAYKPPRYIDVDVPGADLKMRRKRVWYLLYRVRNVGGRRSVTAGNDPDTRVKETFEKPIRFLPHFVLESVEGLSTPEGELSYRGYLDRVVPSAVEPIRSREGLEGRLYDSASMVETEIAPGEERWGVAVWEDVDPRIDYFSIFVRGLTNSIRWRLNENARFSPDDPPGVGTDHALESLRLDFWRTGDEHRAAEEEVSIGHAGLLERMSIGVRLLEALGRPRLTKARPTEGLEQLGLAWRDLLEPVDATRGPAAIDRDAAASLVPLEKVVKRLAAIKDPTARGIAVRDLFGDMGVEWIEALCRGLAGPVAPDREAARREALGRAGVTAADLDAKPLDALAKVLRSLGRFSSTPARQVEADRLFGPEAGRLDALVGELALVRSLAVLEASELDRERLAAGGPRAGFDAIQDLVESEPDPGRRNRFLQGLLGPEGPSLYAAATAVNEGIDHAWVFRYENDVEIPGKEARDEPAPAGRERQGT